MLITTQEKILHDIEKWLEGTERDRTILIPLLQKIQSKYNYVSEYSMQVVADLLDTPPAEVFGVVSFYSYLYDNPRGRHIIRLCRTISCDLAGKAQVAHQLESNLGIKFGETTKDGEYSLEWTNCIGFCDQGPAMMIDDEVHSNLKPEEIHQLLSQHKQKVRCSAKAENRGIQ